MIAQFHSGGKILELAAIILIYYSPHITVRRRVE
jgi:hypothetical protein